MVAVLYPKLPEMVPVHWDLDGGVTYGEKIKLFPLAGLSLVFGILMPLLAKIDPRKQNYERFADAYFGTRIILLVFMIVMMSITLTESLYPGLLQVGRVVCAMVAVLFILLGNLMPKFKSNFFTGMKTPWALSSENVWNKTQRLGGRLFFFGGLVILMSCFVVPEKQLPAAVPVCLLGKSNPGHYAFDLSDSHGHVLSLVPAGSAGGRKVRQM